MIVRRPSHAVSMLAVLACIGATANVAAATTWLVPGDGSGTCTIGSPNCDTIEDAVLASAPADTIQIAAGSFPVPNTLNLIHALTISGAGQASTTAALGGGLIGFDIKADGIVIQDLTIQGGNVGVRFAVASDDTEINRVTFDTNATRGVEFSTGAGTPVTNVSIADSTIASSSAGIRMSSNSTVDGLVITGTTITGNTYGIYQANDGFSSTLTNFTVDGCTFTNNTNYHIYSEEMRDASIEDSSFTGGSVGVLILKFYATNGLPISNVAFRRNQFTGQTGNALDIEMIAMGLGSPITIEDNTIQKNVGTQTSLPAIFLRLHPTQPNGAANFIDNHVSLTGIFGAGTSAHAVWLRGNGPVTFTGNVLDGGNVGGSGTTPPTSGILIEARTSGGTQMPATTSITGSCNRIQGFHNGVSVWNSQASAYGGLLAGSTVSFANNAIDGNDAAGVANGATPVLDFQNNWWGCVAGPGNPGCDAVVGGVNTTPPATAVPACVECTVAAQCDDGVFCNGAETCNGSNQCVAGSDPCSGGPACNNVCNEAADNCLVPDGNACDDSDLCTLDDVCTAGVCGGGPTCGDGVLQGGCGEICDDGNLTSNDGCSATCQFEFVCTPTPLTGCRVAAATKSQLQVKVKGGTKDQLQWKWSKGAITSKADYGFPTMTTEYRLCIYGNGNLVSRETIPASGMCANNKPCWKETKTGFNYKDKDATPDGITSLSLKEGLTAGKAKIGLKGKGGNLDTPGLPLTLPVTVQLRSSNGNCWESVHSSPAQKNDNAQYKDKSD